MKGPTGDQIHDSRDKTSEKFEFTVHRKGLHRFCFTNKSPYHETIDFDIHVGHFAYYDQHAKDGKHPAPLYIGGIEIADGGLFVTFLKYVQSISTLYWSR